MKYILVLVAAGGLLAQQPARPPVPQKPGVPGVMKTMNHVVPDAEYGIEGSPDWLAIGEDMVWVNSKPKDFVARMDPKTSQVVAKVPVTKPCSGLIIGAGSLWSPSCEENVLYRIDLATNKTVAKIPVAPSNTEGGLAFGAGSVWMPSDPKGEITRIDPATNQPIARIKLPAGSHTAIYGYGRIWVSSTDTHVVTVIHPASNEIVATIPVDKAPRFMAVGEGYVWTLNQTNGTVSKIDPVTYQVKATIEAGVAGTGGEIAAGEGGVWITAFTIPITKIDPIAEKVVEQFYGPGGDAIEVGHGYVWLSNGRWSNVWRITPSKLTHANATWLSRAIPSDLDGDAKPDLLLEDLDVWFPGDPTTFRMKVLNPALGTRFQLKTHLNGKNENIEFVKKGDIYEATFLGKEPRWIHYSACVPGSGMCSAENVVASPTTSLAVAKKQVEFVPKSFLYPGPPQIRDYVWNILDTTILDQDYAGITTPAPNVRTASLTKLQDYGEVKRHEWETFNATAYSWGILTADKKEEVACVYIKPSEKKGYDAMVRIWILKKGMETNLEPELEAAVREWIKTRWPFKNVAYPGKDISMKDWQALPSSE